MGHHAPLPYFEWAHVLVQPRQVLLLRLEFRIRREWGRDGLRCSLVLFLLLVLLLLLGFGGECVGGSYGYKVHKLFWQIYTLDAEFEECPTLLARHWSA
jgi:hypothetical protein